jgi:hypothetical protein
MYTDKQTASSFAAWAEIALLPCLLLMLFGWPFVQGNQVGEQVFEGAYLVVVLLAVGASSLRRLALLPILLFGILALVLDTISQDSNPTLERLATVFDLFFAVSLSIFLIAKIFQKGSIATWQVISNALSVYLLIGLAFGAIYNLVGLGSEPLGVDFGFAESDPDLVEFTTTYFSFVTQTTLGYGDISPNNAQIASVAIVQVLIGQFYLAVIVARLVGLVVSKSQS